MVWRPDTFVPLPPDEVPEPEPGSPFGRVYFNIAFPKDGALGKASYHFQTADKCFILYDTAPPGWAFDDGSPFKEAAPVIPFEQPIFDPATYTFTATVTLPKPAFGGELRWKFKMVFDATYSRTIGGDIYSSKFENDGLFGTGGDWQKTSSFGRSHRSSQENGQGQRGGPQQRRIGLGRCQQWHRHRSESTIEQGS